MLHEQTGSKAIASGVGPFETLDLLRDAILGDHAGRIALVSSFGAESVVLLDLVARINRATPVLFNETGMLFAETLDYQREIADRLGLSNIRIVRPTLAETGRIDPHGQLHQQDPDLCCAMRKVAPLKRALQPYAAWITGRKRHQSTSRAALPIFERDEEHRVKINPLAHWSPGDIQNYVEARNLPRHPLIERGYPSIGCAPCTTPIGHGEHSRAGRWRGRNKQECGIHLVDGRLVRLSTGVA